MSSELINILILDYTGWFDTWLFPLIDIYNVTDSVAEVTAGSVYYNATVKRYQYEFTNYNDKKEYVCNVDCWAWAMTRYIWFGLSSNLSDNESTQLDSTVKRNGVIINLWEISIPT